MIASPEATSTKAGTGGPELFDETEPREKGYIPPVCWSRVDRVEAMTARRVIVALVALGMLVSRAEEALAQQAPPAAPDQAPAGLRCRRVDCECAAPPMSSAEGLVYQPLVARGCRQVVCRCDLPAEAESAPPAVEPRPAAVESLPPPQPPEEIFTLEPAPVAGFTLPRRTIGLRLEAGHPFLDAQFAYGLHDAVEIDAGYRGMWGKSNGGYAGLRFRLYRSPSGNAALSLSLLGGYTYVQPGEDHYNIAKFNGGDSGFVEAGFGFTVGRRRHAFIASAGLRLAWVQDHLDCGSESRYLDDCEDTIFLDGHSGFLPVVFLDVGYAVRLHRAVSLYIATGFDAFTAGQNLSGMVRQRFGLMFDF
jgi:hypothetical protein